MQLPEDDSSLAMPDQSVPINSPQLLRCPHFPTNLSRKSGYVLGPMVLWLETFRAGLQLGWWCLLFGVCKALG